MNIRAAIKEDIPRLIYLLTQIRMVHAELRPDLFDKDVTKYNNKELNKMINDNNCPIYVAVIDNIVVGYAMCQKRYQSNLIAKKCFISMNGSSILPKYCSNNPKCSIDTLTFFPFFVALITAIIHSVFLYKSEEE